MGICFSKKSIFISIILGTFTIQSCEIDDMRLLTAARKNNTEQLLMLAAEGVPLICIAAACGKPRVVTEILERTGARDVLARTRNGRGLTALQLTAHQSDLKTMNMLLAVYDNFLETALGEIYKQNLNEALLDAVQEESVDTTRTMELLIDHCADVNYRESQNTGSVLVAAVAGGNLKKVQLLIDEGACYLDHDRLMCDPVTGHDLLEIARAGGKAKLAKYLYELVHAHT